MNYALGTGELSWDSPCSQPPAPGEQPASRQPAWRARPVHGSCFKRGKYDPYRHRNISPTQPHVAWSNFDSSIAAAAVEELEEGSDVGGGFVLDSEAGGCFLEGQSCRAALEGSSSEALGGWAGACSNII